ncbi:DUF4397 domain-containing protein [Dinghuibacter silviterrae]|uniref:Uncharacterized protein DUF4397 n=1 Tax=Dinghuibacter silviterrae TaxID=1539049 RepID=A0A4R8DSF4_9BACT|nr:DUF4397 domain-containing protein [Dinghuibacter silviterrae]TDX01150.1 uncharacterized protein DUF4397 [Dinghuibacter silviterrae]
MRRLNPTVLLTATLVVLGLASCLKTVTNNNSTNPAGVAFVNLAPYGPRFGVFLDGDSVGNQSLFPYASYDSAGSTDGGMHYESLYAGIHSIAFKDSADEILVSGETQFSKNTKYSIFLYDTLTATGLNAVQLQDSYDSIPYGYCLFRFLNFGPNAPSLNVWLPLTVDTNAILTNQQYVGSNGASTATLSQYIALSPNNYTFTFTNYTTGTAIDSFNVTLQSGRAYTMFVTGLLDTSGKGPFKKGLIKMN